MRNYVFTNNGESQKTVTAKELKALTGFTGSLAGVTEAEVSGNRLYLVKKNCTVVYQNVHGTWGFPCKIA